MHTIFRWYIVLRVYPLNKYKYRAYARANVRIIFAEICINRALTVYTALNLPLEEGFDEISRFILVSN